MSQQSKCVFDTADGHKHVCLKCGRVLRTRFKFASSQVEADCVSQRLGIGDYLAIALSKIGITKEAWRSRPVVCGGFIATWQVPDSEESCGCPARQQALNRCWWRWQSRVNHAGWWIRYRYDWLKETVCQISCGRCTTQAQKSEQSKFHESAECQAHSSES